ncbi:MAG: ATP-binding cassette domain-containing protein [Candidatus Paceibacterota bacterium]
MSNQLNNNHLEIIKVENLSKNFGPIKAVDNISFSVKKGEIFGFLGPNGAGKTTTISILCTLLKPTAGKIEINGYDLLKNPHGVRRSIGLVFQETILDNHLTAEENLYFHAMLYGLSRKEFLERKIEILRLCELWEKRKWKISNFSGGMKRRLEIGRALIHYPKILFLDEPTIGLDPQTRNKIWDYLFAIHKKENMTIFLTTQYINEAEICDRIAIIDHGKIVALDSPDNLKKMIGGDLIVFRTDNNDLAEEEFKKNFPEIPLKRIGKEFRIEISSGDEFLPQLVKALTPKITSMELRRPTLEDVFLEITGRRIREAETEEPKGFDLESLISLLNPFEPLLPQENNKENKNQKNGK